MQSERVEELPSVETIIMQKLANFVYHLLSFLSRELNNI